MKNIILAFVSLLNFATSGIYGQNAFRIGTQWEESYQHTISPPFETHYTITSLENPTVQFGHDCLDVYRWDMANPAEKVLSTRVRCEVNKVYYQLTPDTDEWVLLYDFGLQPGEECTVGLLTTFSDKSHEVIYCDLRCVERTTSEEYGGVSCLVLDELKENPDGSEVSRGIGVWLDGIGGVRGFGANAYFRASGVSGELLRVSNGDEELCCLNGYTAIDTSVCDDAFTIYYDLQGCPSDASRPGIYIARKGNSFEKIAVR